MAATEEILELSTIAARTPVRIRSKRHPAGKLYQIVGQADLTLYTIAVIETKAQLLADLDPAVQPSAAKAKAHTKTLRELAGIVAPGIEPDVLASLSDLQLLALFGAFTGPLADASDAPPPAKPVRKKVT